VKPNLIQSKPIAILTPFFLNLLEVENNLSAGSRYPDKYIVSSKRESRLEVMFLVIYWRRVSQSVRHGAKQTNL
jgi:hypothetical protein